MSEYDYSGLYNNGGPQNNNGQPAGTQPEQPQAEQSGYPNVGSSGMNTANTCLLYTSPSPRDRQKSRMPSSA